MKEDNFKFSLYRLNIVDTVIDVAEADRLKGDYEIIQIIKQAVSPGFDITKHGDIHTYKWSIRDYWIYEGKNKTAKTIGIKLAKSLIEQTGEIVTDEGIIPGKSTYEESIANYINIVFLLKRHIVVVENNSNITSSNTWNAIFTTITSKIAKLNKYESSICLEPIPSKEEVVDLFKSFDKLTRLKVNLRLPNPELSRYTQNLYDELSKGGIKEYLQDMKNSSGINNIDEDTLPYATVSMAQQGYKDGEVEMRGIKDGKYEEIKTAETAITGMVSGKKIIEQIRILLRFSNDLARTEDAKKLLNSLSKEVDRLVPNAEE